MGVQRGYDHNKRQDGGKTANVPPRMRKTAHRRRRKGVKTNILTAFFSVIISALEGISNLFNRLKEIIVNLDRRTKITAVAGALLIVILLTFVGILVSVSKPNGFEVYLNNSIVGILKISGHSDIDDKYIMTLVVQKLEQDMGEKVQCYDAISLIKVKSKDFVTLDTIVSEITRKIMYRVQAAVILVNGERKAIVRNQDESDRLLEEIKNEYWEDNRGITHISFVEDVTVMLDYVDASQRMTYSQAKEVLTARELVLDKHTVVANQNLTVIRQMYGMSESSILELNPGLDPNKLSIGQVLTITKPLPLISVKTIEYVTSQEVVRYITEYRDIVTTDKNYYKVVITGQDGQDEITESITRVNGAIETREVVSRKEIRAVRNEVIERAKK